MLGGLNNKSKIKNDLININSINDAYKEMNFSNAIISGNILEKDGKNIRIKNKKTNDIFDIVTKNNLNIKKGQQLEIKKSEVEKMVKVSDEQIEKEKEKRKEDEEELEKIDLKASKENIDALKNLKLHEIPVTKENVLKFASIKDQIQNISLINIDILTKLFSKGYDIDNMSVSKVKELASKIDNTSKINKGKTISYDEAREISNEIYSQKMGKDIYDIIIALRKNNVDITKEKIDKIYDMFSKLSDIQDIESEDIIKSLKQSKDVSIDLLYKIKNYVVSSSISSSSSNILRFVTNSSNEIIIDNNITNQINSFLKENSLEDDFELAKALVENNMDLNIQNITDVKELKEIVEKVQSLMDKEIAAILIRENDDISKMDIRDLLKEIEDIKSSMNPFENLKLSKEEKRLSNQFLSAINSIRPEDVISKNTSIRNLIDKNNMPNSLYEKLYQNNDKRAYQTYSIYRFAQTFSKLSISQKEFQNLDPNKNLSIAYISQKYGLFESNKSGINGLRQLGAFSDDNNIFRHYDYLKNNLRAYHINEMIKQNIDPLNTDIRRINQIIRQDRNNLKNIFNTTTSIDKKSINEITSSILNSGNDFTITNLRKTSDILNNTNNYVNLFEKLKKESKNRNFTEIENSVKKIEKSLKNFDKNNYKQELRENLKDVYSEINKISETLSTTQRKDKEIFKQILKDIDKNIKQSSESIKNQEMIQIPFYLNDQSSNANVFAKTKKNSKGQIDPDDMSILVDINTKKLGKIGFYIKVENKEIKIKISSENDIVNSVRQSAENLDKNLSDIGYEVKNLDIISPENKAKIEFVNENRRTSNSSIDLII